MPPLPTSSRLSLWFPALRDPRPWAALAMGAALVASTVVFSEGLVKVFRIRHQDHRVSVTGSATRRIQSDLIVWKASVKAQAPETAAAYKKLVADVQATQAWLQAQGLDPKIITVSSISTDEVHPRNKEGQILEEQVSAYRMSQSIEISSGDINKVAHVSRAVTELIDRGVDIQSEPPMYIYTRMAELKVQLLADASRDARLRAEQIAKNTGSRVGPLVSAKMGVLQINPQHSSDISWSGNNDRTSLEKDAMAVVTASFSVE
jgi:hypothetical protein